MVKFAFELMVREFNRANSLAGVSFVSCCESRPQTRVLRISLNRLKLK